MIVIACCMLWHATALEAADVSIVTLADGKEVIGTVLNETMVIQTPYAKLEFEQSETVCERRCALSAGCGSLRCPGCDYEFPEEARSVSWLSRIFRRRGARRSSPERGPGSGWSWPSGSTVPRWTI